MRLGDFGRVGHTPSLLAALLHFDVSFMAWVLLGALGTFIAEDLRLTATEKGLMVALPLLSAAVFRIALGILGDRFGPSASAPCRWPWSSRRWPVGASTQAVLGNGRATGARLADGRELGADLIVVATGIRPDTQLACAAGLEVARGVVVDDELRTSSPGVWAVGECAEHRGVVYGLWAPVRRQAQTAAAVLAGRPAAFHGAVPATTLKVMGVDLFCAGVAEAGAGEDEVMALDTRQGSYRKLVLRDERVVGAILLGDLREAGRLRGLVERGAPVPADLLEPAAAAVAAGPADTVCSCMEVRADAIRDAIAAGGLERVEQVAQVTGATTGCGGCRADVEALLRAARGVETVAGSRGIAVGAANRLA